MPTRISWNVIHGFVAVAHVKSSFGNSFVGSRQVAPSFVQAIFRLIAGVPTKYVQESIPSILVPWQSTKMWRDDGDGMRMDKDDKDDEDEDEEDSLFDW